MKLIPRYIFFVIMYCTAYTSVNAQNVIEHFTIEDGLPSNEVHYVHQDSFGYFWFCTDRGISRYDGYEFTNFTTADGLTNNTVFKCFEDENSNLWFTMLDGSVTIYNQKKRVFTAFAGNDFVKKKLISQYWVHKIGFKGNSDDVYFFMLENGYNDSVHVFNNEQFQYSIASTDILKDESLSFVNLVLVSLRIFDTKTMFMSIRKGQNITEAMSRSIKGSIIDFSTKNNVILGMYPAAFFIDSVVYITAPKGMYSLTVSGRSKLIFKDIAPTCVIKDREGIYWVTSRNNGVYMSSISSFVPVSGELSLPKNKKLTCAAALGAEMIIGTDYNTVYRISANGTLQDEYSLKNKIGHKVATLMYNSDSTMLYFYDFEITLDKSVYQAYSRLIEQVKCKPFRFWYQGEYVTNSTYNKIHDGKWENRVRYSARIHSYALIERLLETGRFVEFHNSFLFTNILPNYLIQDSCIYFATDIELVKFYLFSDKIEKIDLGLSETSQGISDFKVIDNSILIATKGYGIYILEDGKVINKVTKEDGLITDMVNTLWIDKKRKRLWCGTTKGVSIFDYSGTSEGIKFVKYTDLTKKDGLFSNYAVSIAATSDKTFIVSDLGLTILPSDLKKVVSVEPILNLLGIVQGDSVYIGTHVSFRYDQNNLEFRYMAVSNKKVKEMYRYKLVTPKDTGLWYMTDLTSIRFNNLSPASYVFQVSARSQNTGWSTPEEYRFTITPRFIDLWWVRSIGIAILLLIGYLFVAIRLKRLQDKGDLLLSNQELELQIARLESSALRGQMNPHFMFNVLNSIQKLILNEEKQDANKLLARFSKLVRSALQYSRLEYIPLTDEVKFLENYMDIEAQRFPDRFTYHIEVADELLEGATIPPLLIQPLCENAIKHAFVEDGGTIWVRISVKDEEHMQIEVEDDGIGMSNTDTVKKSSLGTTIIRDRVKLIEKSGATASLNIELADKKTKKGTLATLILPYN
jgi:ligand-binding sensor domain-containing protein